jgi:hypothetical protein
MSAKFWLETKTLPHTAIAVDSSSFANTPIHGGMNSFGGFNSPVLISLPAAASIFHGCLPVPGQTTRIPAGKKWLSKNGVEMPKKAEHIQTRSLI